MKEYRKHIQNDSKIAISIFENAYNKQVKNPDKLVNVAYGVKITRNNLEDAKLLVSHNLLMLEFDFKDGLVPKKYVEEQLSK